MVALQQSLGATRGCTACLGLPAPSRDAPWMQRTPALRLIRLMPNAASLPSAMSLRTKLQAVVQQMPPAPGIEPLVMPDIDVADSSVVTGASLTFYDQRIRRVLCKPFAEPLMAPSNHLRVTAARPTAV